MVGEHRGRGNFRGGGRGGKQHTQRKHEAPTTPVPVSRTLFVRNVQFDTLESDIRTMFSPFGDIKTIFDLIPKRGLVFITYYDIRAAENAMMGLQNIEFRGRKADIHYSLPKEGDREKNQGSVSVELVGSRSELNNQQLFEYMSRFGEVKVVRDGIAGKKTVSFFDSRACNMALENIPKNDGYADGRLVVALGWDEGHEPAEPMGGGQHKPNYGRQDRGSYGGGPGGRDRHRDMSPRGDDRRMRDRDRDPRRDRDQGRFNDDFRRGRRENSRGFDDDRHGYQQDPYRYDNSPGYGHQPPPPQQQQTLNLLDILQNKGAPPAPYGGGYGQPPAPAPAPTGTTPLLTSLLQSTAGGNPQAQVQQLMSILSQLPQQGVPGFPAAGAPPPAAASGFPPASYPTGPNEYSYPPRGQPHSQSQHADPRLQGMKSNYNSPDRDNRNQQGYQNDNARQGRPNDPRLNQQNGNNNYNDRNERNQGYNGPPKPDHSPTAPKGNIQAYPPTTKSETATSSTPAPTAAEAQNQLQALAAMLMQKRQQPPAP